MRKEKLWDFLLHSPNGTSKEFLLNRKHSSSYSYNWIVGEVKSKHLGWNRSNKIVSTNNIYSSEYNFNINITIVKIRQTQYPYWVIFSYFYNHKSGNNCKLPCKLNFPWNFLSTVSSIYIKNFLSIWPHRGSIQYNFSK